MSGRTQHHSDTLLDHIQSPQNRGRLESPDAVGVGGMPGRGPFIVLHLQINADYITDARYQSEGCGPTIACGSLLTELIIGRSLSAGRALKVEDLTTRLGPLPPNKQHGPALAIQALNDALDEMTTD